MVNAEILLTHFFLVVDVVELEDVAFPLVLSFDFVHAEAVQTHDFRKNLKGLLLVTSEHSHISHDRVNRLPDALLEETTFVEDVHRTVDS